MSSPSPKRRWLVGTGAALLLLAAGALVAWRWWFAQPARPSDDPRLTFATPFRNVHPDVKYAGDTACAQCHPDQAETYRAHPMGRSLFPIADVIDRQRFDKDAGTPFEKLGFEFHVERRDNRMVQHMTRKDADGRTLCSSEEQVDYVVGSGTRGYSYFSNRDGYLFFLPISWYSQAQKWDVSPGLEELYHPAARSVRAECLFCHANHVDHVPHSVNQYRAPIFDGHTIGCERCHGPGDLHVQRRQQGGLVSGFDDTIVNPVHLTPALRDAVCQQCHLEGLSRVLRRHREVFDYRPGLPLHLFWSIFVMAMEMGDHQAVSHFEQMRVSRCYLGSKGQLGCTSCHDPHAVPRDKVGFYRQRCLNCHEQQGCTVPPATRQKTQPNDDCTACHMPRLQSADIVHTAVSDHRVRRVQPAAPAQPRSTRLMPGQIPLAHYHRDQVDPRDPEVARDLGIALIKQVRPAPRQRSALIRPALSLLEKAVQADPKDVDAAAAYGYALWMRGRRDEARAVLEAALAVAPEAVVVLADLAPLVEGMRDRQAAVDYWRRLVRLSPWDPSYRALLVRLLAEANDWAGVIEHAPLALRYRLADTETRQALVQAYLHTGDREKARREYELLKGIAPEVAEPLRPLFAEPAPATPAQPKN